MAVMRRAVLVGIMAAALAGCAGSKAPAPGPVAEAKLDDFAGSWIGASQEEVQRASAVIVEPRTDGGFRLFWRNVQAGDGKDGLEFRERELGFQPSTRPNFWTASVPADRAYATASLAGPTLTVEVVGTTKEGKVERQLYRRTLVDGTHLKLAYTREVAGQPASTIEADFIRKPA
ncbi:hypothetical protein [Inquilinus limosus]|uniref:Lipoprotein n=1 Tax=Inquilinus limosus MP06 TaxID=1398085 RepID=A0A0A0D7D9_9PROT|nr:hypothetical protein [Inquilinus limosus]KGM34000.1 hypothetical protein P409_12675 [Inquilinus limosus MP06]